MKNQNLTIGSLVAVGMIAVIICIGMVTGFAFTKAFISVDPVGDKNVGDLFTITGKTSFPAGTEIIIEVYPAVFEAETGRSGSGEFTGATGTVTIVNGTDGTNTWAWPLDTKTFKPMEYLVSVSSVQGDLSKGDYTKGDISGATKFTLHQGPATAAQEPFIRVDPVNEKKTGDKFSVTGTTNLPAGTEIQVEVYAASFETESGRTGSGEFSGAVGMVEVTRGTGDTNIWSADIDLSTFLPKEYLVNASLFTGDLGKGDFSAGNPFGITKFTVRSASGAAGSIRSQASENGKYIKIDPVPETTTGDLLIVSGSTNLPAGTELMVQAGNSGGGAKVRTGTGGVNRFSSPVDTSGMEPGTKKITVTNMIGDLEKGDYRKGDVNATASFTLKGTYLTTDTSVQATITKNDFIRVNAIGDRSFGDQFLITGTTSLPVGTEVLWQVTPTSLTTDPNQSGTFTGAMANTQVTKGSGITNHVSFAMDTYALLPGQYNVSVSTIAGDLSKGDFRPGDLAGSAYFTLK